MIIFFRSKKLSILLLICIFFNIFIPINQIKAQTNNGLTNMYSKSYCVMDGNNGRVLEEKDSNTELSNASTTKILTCILILENCLKLKLNLKMMHHLIKKMQINLLK